MLPTSIIIDSNCLEHSLLGKEEEEREGEKPREEGTGGEAEEERREGEKSNYTLNLQSKCFCLFVCFL